MQSCRRPGSLAWFVWRRRPNEKRRRPNEKRRRQANSARRRPKKIRDLLRSPALLARAALAEQHLRPLVVHKGGPPTEGASFCTEALWLFSFFSRRQGHKGELRTESPPPKQQVIRSSARRRPFWGGAGRRPPCPNGALLEKNGWVARREEAAGASRWGMWSDNRPSRRCALNMGGQPQVI